MRFKRHNNITIISIDSACLPHLTYFVSHAAPQHVLWSLGNNIFVTSSAAAPGPAGTRCCGGTIEKTAQNELKTGFKAIDTN